VTLHFRAFQATLAGAVADAARATPTRASIPVLNSVRITATDAGRVEVVGFDYDVCIRATLTADVKEAGQALVPGRALAGFLGGMPDGTVDVALDDARLAVTMPRVRYGLRTIAADDYPGLPDIPPVVGTLPAAELARVLGKVLPAARSVAGQEWSGALQLVATTDRLTIAATDRYTVAVASARWDDGPAEPVTVEVGGKALGDALRAMTGDVSVCVGDGGFGLVGAERTFTSRRLAIDYPRCMAIVERIGEPSTTVLLPADELADAMVRSARVVTGDRKPVRLSISADEGLTYDASSDGEDDVAGDLDVESIDGDPVVLGVNPTYLADALKPLGSSVVELGARGPKKAFTVTSPDAPGDIHIIQPIFLP
jgi:DNA polymerase-3 subunit beta